MLKESTVKYNEARNGSYLDFLVVTASESQLTCYLAFWRILTVFFYIYEYIFTVKM